MADVTTTGVFVGAGKPEPVRIEVSVTDNQEIVDVPTVTLTVSPVNQADGVTRRVETFLSAGDAASLGRILLEFAASTEQVIAEGEEVGDDYAG